MLIISGATRSGVQGTLVRAFRAERIIDRVVLDGATPVISSRSWREYWQPCFTFSGSGTRLIHRLNGLKAAWTSILRSKGRRDSVAAYCWRYFGLLHHAIRIALETSRFEEALPVLRRIISFETFAVEVPALNAAAGAAVCHRNPIFLLGRLPAVVCRPTPRHIPLIMPEGMRNPCYHYRQYTLSDRLTKILLFPSVDLSCRQRSFLAVDRFARMTCNREDPYFDSRARVLSQRVFAPLVRAIRKCEKKPTANVTWRMLDLGAGTGHLAGQICVKLPQFVPEVRPMSVELCCVDSSEPSTGRTYGLSGNANGISCVEWLTADYRDLLDNDRWLQEQRPFRIAILSRLLDNMSLFSLEGADSLTTSIVTPERSCLPHRCLARRNRSLGIAKLRVSTTKHQGASGRFMPQFSLGQFFAAMRGLLLCESQSLCGGEWVLPFRRLNPAALTTKTGRSIVSQLFRACGAIVIEDLDLTPEDLKQHMRQFGIANAAAVQFIQDGFSTEAFHYVIAAPEIVAQLKGKRLW